jgi:hypothetical protein
MPEFDPAKRLVKPQHSKPGHQGRQIMNKPIHAIRPIKADIDLPGGQRLFVRGDGKDSVIRIEASGTTVMSIRVTENGAELLFEEGLQMRSEGRLTLDAEQLTIRGRQELRLESDGEVNVKAAGDLYTEGRIQNIRATLGNVNVKANDDVKLRGERILLNC